LYFPTLRRARSFAGSYGRTEAYRIRVAQVVGHDEQDVGLSIRGVIVDRCARGEGEEQAGGGEAFRCMTRRALLPLGHLFRSNQCVESRHVRALLTLLETLVYHRGKVGREASLRSRPSGEKTALVHDAAGSSPIMASSNCMSAMYQIVG
jgi:hypothetical protein